MTTGSEVGQKWLAPVMRPWGRKKTTGSSCGHVGVVDLPRGWGTCLVATLECIRAEALGACGAASLACRGAAAQYLKKSRGRKQCSEKILGLLLKPQQGIRRLEAVDGAHGRRSEPGGAVTSVV
jgi:hypothetical protein